jgi:hypothetical protein
MDPASARPNLAADNQPARHSPGQAQVVHSTHPAGDKPQVKPSGSKVTKENTGQEDPNRRRLGHAPHLSETSMGSITPQMSRNASLTQQEEVNPPLDSPTRSPPSPPIPVNDSSHDHSDYLPDLQR